MDKKVNEMKHPTELQKFILLSIIQKRRNMFWYPEATLTVTGDQAKVRFLH